MIHEPKTLKEARQHSYGRWAGNEKGTPYNATRCAAEIAHDFIFHQCRFKNGKGINGLYCGIHAKKVKS